MAHLPIHNIDEELIAALKKRAAEKGVSIEAEHKLILKQALMTNTEDGWEEAFELCEKSAG